MGLALLLLASQWAAGAAWAEGDAQISRLLGYYEKKTVYVAPEVSVSFAHHAKQLDGCEVLIGEDELCWAC